MLSHAVLVADKIKIRELINSTVILAAENNPPFSFWVLTPRNETGDRTRQDQIFWTGIEEAYCLSAVFKILTCIEHPY